MTTGSHLTTGIFGKLKKDKIEVVMVLGIRPDIIRACLMIEAFRASLGKKFALVWSGQHYSDNLKDIFFRQLNVGAPDFDLSISGKNDSELVSSMITKLSILLDEIKPRVVLFLGDTNTVMGAIASSQLNIPTFHIEGCMRSYDWRMPEEKYRTTVDHLSDRIYAYLDEYRQQGIAEGIPEKMIRVCGNPIVDVLETFFINGKLRMSESDKKELLNRHKVEENHYLVMTAHRRENVIDSRSLGRIMHLAGMSSHPVIFPAGYRTQAKLKEFRAEIPDNVMVVDPIGYLEILELMVSSTGVLTDSGTIVEEAAILGVPTIQMRHSTERPQVYDLGASVKFDPVGEQSFQQIIQKFSEIAPRSWEHGFGDGNASSTIVEDVLESLETNQLRGHMPDYYLPFSKRSFIG